MAEQPEGSEYKISDRRRFSGAGEALEKDNSADPSGETALPSAAAPAADVPREANDEPLFDPVGAFGAPPAKFEILVLSLAMQAQIDLGLHGASEENPPDLNMARHTIDLIGVLQEKTKGNLTFEEQRMLENTLTELRFRYIQVVEEFNQQAKSGS